MIAGARPPVKVYSVGSCEVDAYHTHPLVLDVGEVCKSTWLEGVTRALLTCSHQVAQEVRARQDRGDPKYAKGKVTVIPLPTYKYFREVSYVVVVEGGESVVYFKQDSSLFAFMVQTGGRTEFLGAAPLTEKDRTGVCNALKRLRRARVLIETKKGMRLIHEEEYADIDWDALKERKVKAVEDATPREKKVLVLESRLAYLEQCEIECARSKRELALLKTHLNSEKVG